ncbi:beta-glucosidase [Belliella buryatensis]|uniref:beta-N-acetylhexosaminidase n=1 Tax=Belliella buryatensis TaxID=1500549 RepID=A0A239CRH5_9BACT|nr:glycoside hydrolase family 3 protein [Belliella buryatensis]SNS22775.1 beta-glucosidase [Belliella buryatensis]
MNRLQKIAQLFSPAAFVHDSEEEIQKLEQLIKLQQIGGVTFFHSRHSAAANFEGRQEKLTFDNSLEKLKSLIKRYQSISKTPLLISIDAEFGLAMRIEQTPQYPYAITLGQLPIEMEPLIFESGKLIGEDLKAIGIHLNLAPVADCNTNPNNPVIGYRAFGDDKEKVSRFALAQYKGMIAGGIAACYKHFPGHGDTAVDSHLGLPIIDKTKEQLLQEELYPFIAGIKQGVDMIMVGHLAVPALTKGERLPASLSKHVLKNLLREELGFNGIVISDALNMKAVSELYPTKGELEWKAFDAGNDILCFSENITEGIHYINQNATDEQIDLSYQRIYNLKNKLGLNTASKPTFSKLNDNKANTFNQIVAQQLFNTHWDKAQITHLLKPKDKIAFIAAFNNLEDLKTLEFNNLNFHETHQLEDLNQQKLDLITEEQACILGIFLPSAKPINQFGMDQASIDKIKVLSQNPNVLIIHFGNPLATKIFITSQSKSTILQAYQALPEFQSQAWNHLQTLRT